MPNDKPEVKTSKLYAIADELHALANLGLHYAKNEYDRERFERVLTTSARLVSALDDQPLSEVVAQFKDNFSHVSPLAGAEAAVFRDNRLMLMKRHDDGLWAVPGGLVDVGETLGEAAIRELREESGLVGKITRLLGVFDSRIWKSQMKSQLYHVIFEVIVTNGTPAVTNEATDWGFFSSSELPDLSPGHAQRVPVLFKLMNGDIEVPYFDSPDNRTPQ